MRIPDFLRMNNWNIRKFSIVTLSLLIAYDGTFLMNKFLFDISILPQLLGFIVLTFIPGFVILRILKVHNIDRVTNFLLAVGLSLSFIMIYGLLLNTLLPHLGILKPMSPQPLFYAFNIGILALLLVSYLRDRGFKPSSEFLNVRISPLMLSLLLLPFLSIFGAYVMTFYDSNILILVLLFLISLTPVAVVFNKIPKNLYPLLIFLVSLSILYHVNLISTHLWSFDIFFESYAANWVVEKGIWDPNQEFNQLLLISVLAPTYSLLCDLSLVWVFKTIFPFFFALAPLALYQVYQRIDFGEFKLSPILALFSVFIFVFFYGFSKVMPDKQHIAELFMALILMLMVTDVPNRVPISIILSFSLITSHYGVSYVFMLSLIFALFLSCVWKEKEKSLTPNFVLLFSVLAICWYMYVAQGDVFEHITHIGNHIVNKILEILKPDYRSGVTYLTYETPSILWQTYKFIHIVLQIFIAVGIVNLWISILKGKSRNDISFLSTAFYILLVFQITTTYGMGFDRVLQITLVLLSPFAVTGCLIMSELVAKIGKDLIVWEASQRFFAIFLLFFFLFNSGFVFEVSNDVVQPYCIALNKSTWEKWHVFNRAEVSAAIWIKSHSLNTKVSSLPKTVCKDSLVLAQYYRHVKDFAYFNHYTTSLPSGICVYLGSLLTERGKIPAVVRGEVEYLNLDKTPFYQVLSKSDKVFDSRSASVYYVP